MTLSQPDADRPRVATTPTPSPIAIANAGLILTSVYLPMLFERLGLLIENPATQPAFTGPQAVSRGVHLLQSLVGTPDPELALNKILCGVPPSYPGLHAIVPTPQESELTRGLLLSLLAHWSALGNTSIEALQHTFLQREGKLQLTDSGWQLQVQRKTLDVLLDSFPATQSVILHPWMPQPIHVIW